MTTRVTLSLSLTLSHSVSLSLYIAHLSIDLSIYLSIGLLARFASGSGPRKGTLPGSWEPPYSPKPGGGRDSWTLLFSTSLSSSTFPSQLAAPSAFVVRTTRRRGGRRQGKREKETGQKEEEERGGRGWRTPLLPECALVLFFTRLCTQGVMPAGTSSVSSEGELLVSSKQNGDSSGLPGNDQSLIRSWIYAALCADYCQPLTHTNGDEAGFSCRAMRRRTLSQVHTLSPRQQATYQYNVQIQRSNCQ